MSHEESPWKNTPHGCAITFQQMREHFESLPGMRNFFPTPDRETLKRMPDDPQVRRDLKRGIAAMKAGQMTVWEEMKGRLGIQ